MEMKKEMMLNAIQLGLNMGAEGCIAVLSREELEILANANNEEVTKEKEKEIIAQVYVNQVRDLFDKLEALGYDIIIDFDNDERTISDMEIEHDNRTVVIW